MNGALATVLSWLGLVAEPARRKVPILGVEASGKSSLALTLGQYVSSRGLGRVPLEHADLFTDYVSCVAAGLTLPATMDYTGFSLDLTRVPEEDGSFTDVDLVLSSEDIPGQDFRDLVDELRANPDLARAGGPSDALLARFCELLSECDGFVFVIDLVRGVHPAEFRRAPARYANRALADQLKPIMTGLLIATKTNRELAGKPVFFVFSKPDLHGLSERALRDRFEMVLAIPLAQLRGELLNVRHYSVQCAGWGLDEPLDGLGVGSLLSDLVHAVGAAGGGGW